MTYQKYVEFFRVILTVMVANVTIDVVLLFDRISLVDWIWQISLVLVAIAVTWAASGVAESLLLRKKREKEKGSGVRSRF